MNSDNIKTGVPPVESCRTELPGTPAPKRHRGWPDGGLCSFHDDAYKGNFRVNASTGRFCDFACGAKGGGIITFCQLRHGWSFSAALEAIANAWGIHA